MKWPDFDTAQALADGRTWTARFTGLDELREVAGYTLRILDGERARSMRSAPASGPEDAVPR